jgi:hypothetical protein
MKRLRFLLVPLLIAGAMALALPAATASASLFNPFDTVCTQSSGGEPISGSVVCGENAKPHDANPISGTTGILLKVVNLILIMTAVASVIMIMIGGLRYILSAGDANKVSGAKDQILYAIIGLIVSLMARGILLFIINRVIK